MPIFVRTEGETAAAVRRYYVTIQYVGGPLPWLSFVSYGRFGGAILSPLFGPFVDKLAAQLAASEWIDQAVHS
jgi:hypothetical protein